FFFQAEDGIRDRNVTGVQTCALPISLHSLEMPRLYHRWTVSGLKLEYSAARSCVMSRRTHKVMASSSFQVRFAFCMASSTRSDDGQRKNLTVLSSSIGFTSP